MTASVLDAVRSSQPSSAAAVLPLGKPTRKFDDVLAGHRVKPEPKSAPVPAEHAKANRPKGKARPADKIAKPKHGDENAAPEADAVDESAEQTESNGPTHAKPLKKADGKTKAHKTDDADEAETATDSDATSAATDNADTADACDAGLPAVTPKAATGEKPKSKEGTSAGDTAANQSPGAAPELAAAQTAVATQASTPSDGTTTGTTAETPTAAIPATDVAVTQAAASTDAKPDAKSAAAKAVVDTTATDAATAAAPQAKTKLKAKTDAKADADPAAAARFFVPTAADASAKPADRAASIDADADAAAALQAVASNDKPAPHETMPTPPTNAPAQPRTVAEENVDRIVTSVRGEMQKGGGTMSIRLDPPSLGQVQVHISVNDGVLSASLQTSNDEATRLLSHNLQQLKTTLESAGISVDRIQVKQAAPGEQSSSSNSHGGSDGGERGHSNGASQDQGARQEQQRREMLQRMWAKLAGSGDPLDLVA